MENSTAALRNETLSSFSPVGDAFTELTTTTTTIANYSGNSSVTENILRLYNASNITFSSSNSSSEYSGFSNDSMVLSAGPELATAEHSKGAFYAWVGLGILLVGIVFILGFVFVFDKFLRKKFFNRSNDPESDRSKAEQTDGGKKPTDLVIGEPNLPTEETAAKKDDAASSEAAVNGSSESLAKRKRQEKVDETNVVELKPL